MKQVPKRDELTMERFLRQMGLFSYNDTLLDKGYMELNSLLRGVGEMASPWLEMEKLGMKPGEAKRLVAAANRLKETRVLTQQNEEPQQLMVGDVVCSEHRFGVVQSITIEDEMTKLCVKSADGAYVWLDAEEVTLQGGNAKASLARQALAKVVAAAQGDGEIRTAVPLSTPSPPQAAPLVNEEVRERGESLEVPVAALEDDIHLGPFRRGLCVRIIETGRKGIVESVSEDKVNVKIEGSYGVHGKIYQWLVPEALEVVQPPIETKAASPPLPPPPANSSIGTAISKPVSEVGAVSADDISAYEVLHGGMKQIKGLPTKYGAYSTVAAQSQTAATSTLLLAPGASSQKSPVSPKKLKEGMLCKIKESGQKALVCDLNGGVDGDLVQIQTAGSYGQHGKIYQWIHEVDLEIVPQAIERDI